MSVTGIILAAGESRRMGTPKALLRYRGETFLDRLIGLYGALCAPVLVVLGANPDPIRAGIRRAAEACFVLNPDWSAGQLTSLQAALRSHPPAEGVLFTLVDHPAVQPETLARLVRAEGRLRLPRFQGKRGHPLYFEASLAAEFLALPATASAREVLQAHAGEITCLDVDDPGVLLDIDDPTAYAALRAGEGVQ